MQKIYQLRDLDCANCAAKMEEAIKKIDGINNASVSFMTQKLTIETDEDINRIIKEVVKVVVKIEPDCEVIL